MSVKSIWGTAGTGKTTYLQKNFVKSWCGTASQVGLVTFRRNTANQIKDELSIMLNHDVEDLADYVNTIHGMCLRNIGMNDYEIVDHEHIEKFNELLGYKFTQNNHDESSNGMLDCYGWLKNNMMPFSQVYKYRNLRSLKKPPAVIIKQLNDYEKYKQSNQLIDFSDMLTITLENNICPDFKTLYVDEFQDLTPLQFEIFKMWCKNIENVTIAGDPLQSIYGFWGASPDFFNTFDDCTILPKSHRLPRKVWQTGVSILKRAGLEYPDIETNGHEGVISHISHKQYQNHDCIKSNDEISTYHLVRSRYQAPAIAALLSSNGVLFSGLHGWNGDLIKTFNVILKIRNGEPLIRSDVVSLFHNYPLKYFHASSKFDFSQEIKTMSDKQIADIHGGIVKTILFDLVKSDAPLGKSKKSLRQSMINGALTRYTYPIKSSDIKTTLETIHGAKGGERDRVFLHTGITPKIKKGMRRNPKEEARVWFVGVTRTKNELFIVKDKGTNYNIKAVV